MARPLAGVAQELGDALALVRLELLARPRVVLAQRAGGLQPAHGVLQSLGLVGHIASLRVFAVRRNSASTSSSPSVRISRAKPLATAAMLTPAARSP